MGGRRARPRQPPHWEICQSWLRHETDAAAAGRWWGKVRQTRGKDLRSVDREIDAVAVDDDGTAIAIGSCKWTAGALPHSEKEKLEILARHLVPDGPLPDLYFFARSGFDPRLVQDAETDPRIRLVTPDKLM